mmetsp:Transcript_26284/g.84907  ORF Transcript_26284/g.84907 Transcript_26284/m.84907 type:complete len:377 (-) Transcript_26284:183-1313(-)
MRPHRLEEGPRSLETGDGLAAPDSGLSNAGLGRCDPAHQDQVLVPSTQRRLCPRRPLRVRAPTRIAAPPGRFAKRVVRPGGAHAVREQGRWIARCPRHSDQPAHRARQLAAGHHGAPRPLAPPGAQPRQRLPGGPADGVRRGPRLPDRDGQDRDRHRPAGLIHPRVPRHDHDDPRKGLEGALRAHRAARVPHHRVFVARHPILHVQAVGGHRPRHSRLPQGQVAGQFSKHRLLDLHQVHHRRTARLQGGAVGAQVEGPGRARVWLLPDGGLQPLHHRQAQAKQRPGRLSGRAPAARPGLGAQGAPPRLAPASEAGRRPDPPVVRQPPRRDSALRPGLVGRRRRFRARVHPVRRSPPLLRLVRRHPAGHCPGVWAHG